MAVVKYSYLNSKVKAKTSKLLSPQDYEQLLHKSSVQEVASYLKHKTSYGHVLRDLDENTAHRGEIEKILSNAQFRRCQKLMKLIKGKESKFMQYNIIRYEIEDLKLMIRTLHIHHSLDEIEKSLFILEKTSLDIKKLLASKTLSELVDGLKGTEYYNILNPLIKSDDEASMFTIEMALDLYYYRWILKAKERYLSGEDKRIITKSIGEEIDVLNLIWLFRVKKYYKMDKDLVYRYILPSYYHLTKEELQTMVEAESLEDLLNLIEKTTYNHIFDEDKSILFDYNYRRFIMTLQEKLLKTKPFSIASIISYLHIKEVEMKNIISIIEGIRYGLSGEKIKSMIVPIHIGRV